MISTKDIRERIEFDFGDKTSEAINIIEEAIAETEYLSQDRIIRCIIFLANKDLDKLRNSIQSAIEDPRNVMLWAEYKNLGINENPKRIRDFNKTFAQSENNVKE
jgi:hypothetical protein